MPGRLHLDKGIAQRRSFRLTYRHRDHRGRCGELVEQPVAGAAADHRDAGDPITDDPLEILVGLAELEGQTLQDDAGDFAAIPGWVLLGLSAELLDLLRHVTGRGEAWVIGVDHGAESGRLLRFRGQRGEVDAVG